MVGAVEFVSNLSWFNTLLMVEKNQGSNISSHFTPAFPRFLRSSQRINLLMG